MNDVRGDERQQQHAKQLHEPVTREEATDARRRQVDYQKFNVVKCGNMRNLATAILFEEISQ